jgi:hypothetical protein
VSRHPHDTVAVVDDNGNGVATFAHDLVVDEKVLQFLAAPKPKRPKAVARTPVSDDKAPRILIEPDDRNSMPGRKRPRFQPVDHLGRDDATCLGHSDLPWDRQRILK